MSREDMVPSPKGNEKMKKTNEGQTTGECETCGVVHTARHMEFSGGRCPTLPPESVAEKRISLCPHPYDDGCHVADSDDDGECLTSCSTVAEAKRLRAHILAMWSEYEAARAARWNGERYAVSDIIDEWESDEEVGPDVVVKGEPGMRDDLAYLDRLDDRDMDDALHGRSL